MIVLILEDWTNLYYNLDIMHNASFGSSVYSQAASFACRPKKNHTNFPNFH